MLRKMILLTSATFLGGCNVGSNYTGTYVGGDETALIKLNIVEGDDDRVNATMSISAPNFDKGKMETKTGGLSGIRNGKSINLIAANPTGGSITLVDENGKLVWQIPNNGQSIEFVEADAAEYQRRLVELSNQLNGNDVGLIPDDI